MDDVEVSGIGFFKSVSFFDVDVLNVIGGELDIIGQIEFAIVVQVSETINGQFRSVFTISAADNGLCIGRDGSDAFESDADWVFVSVSNGVADDDSGGWDFVAGSPGVGTRFGAQVFIIRSLIGIGGLDPFASVGQNGVLDGPSSRTGFNGLTVTGDNGILDVNMAFAVDVHDDGAVVLARIADGDLGALDVEGLGFAFDVVGRDGVSGLKGRGDIVEVEDTITDGMEGSRGANHVIVIGKDDVADIKGLNTIEVEEVTLFGRRGSGDLDLAVTDDDGLIGRTGHDSVASDG